jgi:formate dehydrogenase maturation protein FdhE
MNSPHTTPDGVNETLPTIRAVRPRCVGCRSVKLAAYKSLQRSTGAVWRYVKCKTCGKRQILILS